MGFVSLNTFDQKARGLAVHATTAGINYGILMALQAAGLPLLAATSVSTCTGNLLAFIGDILFAKRDFKNIGFNPTYAKRLNWLLRAFISVTFVRFITVTIIEVLIMNVEFDYFKSLLDRRRIGTGFKYRDLLLIMVLGVFNFIILINMLRFDWAYAEREKDDLVLHVVVGAWMFMMMGIVSIKQKL
jgi:hypothetical protein